MARRSRPSFASSLRPLSSSIAFHDLYTLHLASCYHELQVEADLGFKFTLSFVARISEQFLIYGLGFVVRAQHTRSMFKVRRRYGEFSFCYILG